MKWKGKPLRAWLNILNSRDEAVEGLTYSLDCLICDLALETGKSKKEFFAEYDAEERAQLVATYRSQKNRETVMAMFPLSPRGKHGVS